MANNQKEKIFSNKVVQNFLENDPKFTQKNKYKFAEIASSLAYYLKSFSNINKLLDYVSLIFKHIFSENIILIMPLNYEGEIWNENIKISVNHEYLPIQAEDGIRDCLLSRGLGDVYKRQLLDLFWQIIKKKKYFRIKLFKIF